MSLTSMTGFARAAGALGPWRWTVEIKCVNAKGLDLRLRLPPGFDRIEAEARTRIGKALARGAAAKAGLAPPTMDGVLAVRGVVEVVEAVDDEASFAAVCAGALESLDAAIAALVVSRRAEGAALQAILAERLDAIASLTQAADDNPARRPEAVRARLAAAVAALLESSRGFDENRLHQEGILLAAKADIREELDRLKTHVAAARALIEEGGPVGRRLDFLAQELGREANTLCAKANDVSLTAQGLELRAQIEQLREQVQNIE